MKKLLILFLFLITIQTIQAQKYGYIDKDELLRSIPEYDSAMVQVEKMRKQYENQLANMQGELSSKTETLNKESAGISEFLRKTKQDEINNLNIRIQLFSVRATAQLEENQKMLLRPLIEKADKAMNDVAKEQGFVFVLDASQLYYADEKKCTNILPLVKTKMGLK
jgi:outer membrane protein